MKKSLLLLCLLPCSVFAQSTCETRVDAHQKATTRQRVAYCLIPSYGAAAETNRPGVVFSGVSSNRVELPAQPRQQAPTASNGSFHPDSVEVTQNYIGSRRFPQLKNERLSEQEKLARRNALAQGQEAAAHAADLADCEEPPKADREPCLRPFCVPGQTNAQRDPNYYLVGGWVEASAQTKAGVNRRQQKPQRRNMAQAAQEAAQPQQAAPRTYPANGAYGEYEPYDPVGEAPIALGTQSYAPSTGEEPVAPGTRAYAPAGEEPVAPNNTRAYAPAK